MSPNLTVIPSFDPQPAELRARSDGRFGIDDYICHPQGHSELFPWITVVPRKPTSPQVLADHLHHLLWYNLATTDWVVFMHMGTLDVSLYTEMYVKAVEINMWAVSVWTKHLVPH